MARRAVLTLALGKPYYTGLAVNLARSFAQWNDLEEIEFHLVTDHPEHVPDDLAGVHVRAARPGEFGAGFATKLHLDRIAPGRQTLFVDADCLVVGPLGPVFDRFAGRPVAVPGTVITEGQFSGDVAAVSRRLGIPGMIQFVGGIYYLEPGPRCSAVFDEARALEREYDELGLVRLRGVPNEEPLLSIAMVRHGLEPVQEDGTIKADALCYPSVIEVDVFRGAARLENDPADPLGFRHWETDEARPVIVHFNCSFAERDPYLREVERLRRVRGAGWPLAAATAYAWAAALPRAFASRAKDVLRPMYRRLFGTRPIAASPRM
jgi:hypothetical protein